MTALREMIEGFGEARTSEILRAYRSVRDSDTESFLRDRAVEMEKRDLSRTYLFLGPGPDRVLGYVTLGIKCLAVPEDGPVSGRMRRGMNVDARTNVAQAYLLGQLSRSADAPKGTGAALLDLAFEHFDAARREVGCRIVRLDCRDELVSYYASYGFMAISRNECGRLNQMVALIRGFEGPAARPRPPSGHAPGRMPGGGLRVVCPADGLVDLAPGLHDGHPGLPEDP